MTKYESMYILRASLEDEKKDAAVARFSDIVTKNGGEVTNIDEWGKRKLAYPIDYMEEGYYVVMYFNAPPTLVSELERNYKISDDVIRFMVINLDKE